MNEAADPNFWHRLLPHLLVFGKVLAIVILAVVVERLVYVLLRTAQDLLNLPGGASNINVTVSDIWNAEVVAQVIEARVGLHVLAGMVKAAFELRRQAELDLDGPAAAIGPGQQ